MIDRLLRAFRRAAADVPAYRALLDEHGVVPSEIVDAASFSRLCPLTSKDNTFNRFELDQLCVAGGLRNLAGVLTSSGHSGRFAFGVSSREQAAAGADFIDEALDAAFKVRKRSTLAINCLPMGVGFSSRVMTVAATSVREDMAIELVRAFAGHYDQILLVGDPLFLKRLTDRAVTEGVDWSRYRINVVIGEEIFGEQFRGYLAARLALDLDRPEDGYIMSSFGAGELGLHLCYETAATIAVHRAASHDQELARGILAADSAVMPPPMLFTFNPLRTFIEVADPDEDGYGRLTISMLDDEAPLPLLRYQTGDVARLLDVAAITRLVARRGIVLPSALPPVLLALKGRDKDALPNGSHLSVYKEALYADHPIARQLSGAFRLVFAGPACTMHVQLTGDQPDAAIEQALLRLIPDSARPARLVLWPHATFPFGMGLDYERKFSHYVPGESNPAEANHERRR